MTQISLLAKGTNDRADRLVSAACQLSENLSAMSFTAPVSHVYNPLDYAWLPHEAYLRRFGASKKHVIFLGMNPGPFGMVQTGVPFGEVDAVTRWMGLSGVVSKPQDENPKRPIEGFNCTRSEVSGRRLWGLFEQRFGRAEIFFAQHFVANYCPLAFFDGGRNITPDKLPANDIGLLESVCDEHLRVLVKVLEPEWLIGVGAFAEKRAREALAGMDFPNVRVGRVLHPSPASPAANRGWAEAAERQLVALGVWSTP